MYIFVNSHLPNRVMSQMVYMGEAKGVKEEVHGSLFWLTDLDKFRAEVPQTVQDKIILTPIHLDCRGKDMHALKMVCEGYNNHLRSIT